MVTKKKAAGKGSSTWASARERSKTERPPGAGLSTGKHVCRVVGGEVVKSEKDGSDRVQWIYMDVRGDEAGELQYDWNGTTAPEGSDYTDEDFQTWLFQRFGQYAEVVEDVDLDAIAEADGSTESLKAAVAAVVEACPRVQFTIKEKDGYSNVKGFKVFPEDDQENETDDLDRDAALEKFGETNAGKKAGGGKKKASTKKSTKPDADEAKPGKKSSKKAAEPEPDDVDLEAGMKVSLNYKGEDCTGKIVEIDEDDDNLTVKLLDGKKKGSKVVVEPDDVEVLDD